MSNMNSTNDSVSASKGEKAEQKSGETTPAESRSLFSGRGRSNTETTLVSSVAETGDSISTAGNNPAPPVNSPEGGSIAGDAGVSGLELMSRVLTITPEETLSKDSGSSQRDPQDNEKRGGVKESSLWEDEAIAAAGTGLARLVQLARDENERDPSKSVEEYYSQHLSKVIKKAEIEFDKKKLE